MKKFHPFQWVIDTTQRRPIWWCRLVLKMGAMGLILALTMRNRPFAAETGTLVTAFLMVIAMYWIDCRSEARLVSKNLLYVLSSWIWWPATTVDFYLFMKSPSSEHAAVFLLVISMGCFCSFALCRPPAPPKQKPSFVPRPMGA